MSARELLGAPVGKALREDVAARVESLATRGVTPRLAIVRVGEQAGDLAYERGATKRMEGLGIACDVHALPADVSQKALEARLRNLAEDPSVHGILMLRPLPRELDEARAIASVPAEKDVDGMTPASMAALYSGANEGFAPCTAEAVVRLLDFYEVSLEGARVVVLGRSLVVGKPVAQLLLARNATVTTCHSRTRSLPEVCRGAEVLVSAMGRAHAVTAEYVCPGAVVIDVGTNDDGEGGITGDVDYAAVSEIAGALTPVPRGVGSITTSVLAEHVTRAAERSLA